MTANSESTLAQAPRYWRDQWCAKNAVVASLEFTNTAADKDFPSVVVPSSFLPSGATVLAVNLILKWRKMMEDSGSENYINAASKAIRAKISTGAWGTDDIVAMTFTNGMWKVAASATEGGDVLISTEDIKAVVTGVAATYNFRSEQTNRTDALVMLGDGMTLYDVETGLRVWYTV
jgi:hypothetical protein